jgi:hypothetical protein
MSVMLGEGLDLLLAMFQTEDQYDQEVANIVRSKLNASAHEYTTAHEYPNASGLGDFILEAVQEPMTLRHPDGRIQIVGWSAKRLVEEKPLEREALDSPLFQPPSLLSLPGFQALHQSLRAQITGPSSSGPAGDIL